MPKLGLTMTEGALAQWMVVPGNAVKAGDVLFVVETDKVASEVSADVHAVLLDIVVPAGETVPVGTVIGHLEVASSEGLRAPAAGGSSAIPAALEVRPAPVHDVQTHAAPGPRQLATPLARRLAAQRGLPIDSVKGTGPRGRIRRATSTPRAPWPRPQSQPGWGPQPQRR